MVDAGIFLLMSLSGKKLSRVCNTRLNHRDFKLLCHCVNMIVCAEFVRYDVVNASLL